MLEQARRSVLGVSVALIITLAAAPAAPAPLASTHSIDSKTYYDVFLKYRQALSDQSLNCSRYFSAKVNEAWIGDVLVDGSSNELIERPRTIRHRYRFGDQVSEVYEYKAALSRAELVQMTIIYKSSGDRRVETMKLSYVMEGGSERIASMLFDSRPVDVSHLGRPISVFSRTDFSGL